MKGYKKIAAAVYANAKVRNNTKEHGSGKENKCKPQDAWDYSRINDENLSNALPHPMDGVTRPISERKLALVRRHLGYGRSL